MIKDNQKYFNRIQVLLDAAIVIFSYILAWFIKFRILDAEGGALSMGQYFRVLYVVVPGYLILYSMLFKTNRVSSGDPPTGLTARF